jgi:hypothetical protein
MVHVHIDSITNDHHEHDAAGKSERHADRITAQLDRLAIGIAQQTLHAETAPRTTIQARRAPRLDDRSVSRRGCFLSGLGGFEIGDECIFERLASALLHQFAGLAGRQNTARIHE